MGVGSKIKLNSIDSLFGSSESVTEVMLSELHEFKDHPFKVFDDEAMEQLIESIKENGILVPATVRPLETGGYEIISGHRRRHAAEKAGLTKMPVVIREMTDEEATVAMVDSNLQREELLPSERAFAYKMKYDALKASSKLGRPKKDEEATGRTVEKAEEELGTSKATIMRYISLTALSRELLELVDDKKIKLNAALELTGIDTSAQDTLYQAIEETETMPSPAQAKDIKSAASEQTLTIEVAKYILTAAKLEKTKFSGTFKIKKEVQKAIPEDFTQEQLDEIANKLLADFFADPKNYELPF